MLGIIKIIFKIPCRFLFLFFSLGIIWIVVFYIFLNMNNVYGISDLISKILSISFVKFCLKFLLSGLILMLILFLTYNCSAYFYRRIRKRSEVGTICEISDEKDERKDSEMARPNNDVIDKIAKMHNIKSDELKIGIVLAGGGAKGAYQAGAMKAIYEFLENNGILNKVKMIAGTSIGSWNALFWIAQQLSGNKSFIKSPKTGISIHEEWWRNIRLDKIMEFAYYFPLRQNYLVESTPWQEMFDDLFTKNGCLDQAFYDDTVAEKPLHFYITRTNVIQGILEFATNRLDLLNNKNLEIDEYDILKKDHNCYERLKMAVFASMGLPPLFPHMKIKTDKTEWFEDGGVVENLPIKLNYLEGCHLLFVLPLNASFEEELSSSSVISRLMRVIDVRQGALENHALQMISLYNALNLPDFNQVSVFSVCPQPPLKIGTMDFENGLEAGYAFELMYSATRKLLHNNFFDSIDPYNVRMNLVTFSGEVIYKTISDYTEIDYNQNPNNSSRRLEISRPTPGNFLKCKRQSYKI